MLTVDLHMHSNFSDGKLSIERLVDLYGQSGFDAIAITDHLCAQDSILGISARYLGITLNKNNWKSYIDEIEKQRNRAWREYKMLVYSGVEFTRNTFSHGRNSHLLALNIQDFIDPTQSEELWLKMAKEVGATTVAAHPMKVKDAASQTYFILNNRKKFEPLIDIWEVANVRTFWREMLKLPFALMATSDLHTPKNWASWRTQIDCEKDPEALLAAMKNPSIARSFVLVTGNADEITHKIDHKNNFEEVAV